MKVAFLAGIIIAFIISAVVSQMQLLILFAIISSIPFFYLIIFKTKKEVKKWIVFVVDSY